MAAPLVLSLFPGADLFGRAFELAGCSVVRGPDLLIGHRMTDWVRPPPGRFDGVIGGPPCQHFSRLRDPSKPSRHLDQIGVFWKAALALEPSFVVMENLPQVLGHDDVPIEAHPVIVRDWDCGGHTSRRRLFYFWPGWKFLHVKAPPRRAGFPARAVLASDYRRSRKGNFQRSKGRICAVTGRDTIEGAWRMQGFPEALDVIKAESDGWRRISKSTAYHMAGNGVPRALGQWVASVVLDAEARVTRGVRVVGAGG